MIKRMILLQTVILSFTCSLILIGTLLYTRNVFERQTEQLLLSKNKLYLEQISMAMTEKAVAIRQLGYQPSVLDYAFQVESRNEALTHPLYEPTVEALKITKQTTPDFDLIWLAHRRGSFFIGDGGQLSRPYYPVEQRPWFRDLTFERDIVQYSNPYVDAITKKLTVSVIFPLFHNRLLTGVIGGDLLLDQLPAKLNALTKGDQQTWLIARDGTIIYHSKNEQWIAQSVKNFSDVSRFIQRTNDGQQLYHEGDFYYVSSQVDHNGWHVVTSIADTALQRQLTDYTLKILGAFVLFYLLLVSLTSFILHRSLQHIPHLVNKLNAIATGEGKVAAITIETNDEIGAISRTIDELNTKVHHSLNEVYDLAYRDPLTKVANRRFFMSTLREWIERGERFSVLYIDLDNFKHINDRWGHSAGDEFLCQVTWAMDYALQGRGFLARIGGDEFVVLYQVNDAVVHELEQRFTEPIIIEDMNLTCHFSGGVVRFPTHATSVEALLQKADTAMYTAKQRGKQQIYFLPE